MENWTGAKNRPPSSGRGIGSGRLNLTTTGSERHHYWRQDAASNSIDNRSTIDSFNLRHVASSRPTFPARDSTRGRGWWTGGGRGAPRPFGPNSNQRRRPQNAGLDKFTLSNLTEDSVEPAEIIRVLETNIHDLLLNHGNDCEYLELLLVALGEFCKKNGCTQFTDGFVGVIQSLANKRVFAQVSSVILFIPSGGSLVKCSTQKRIERFLTSIYCITSDMLTVMPNVACNFLVKNYFVDIMAMKSFPSVRHLGADHAFDSLEHCNALFQSALEQHVPTETNKKTKQESELESEELLKLMTFPRPPNDFRTLNIMPNIEDMFGSEEPFLRPNIVKGRYPDAVTYLDVQFRLLREDFFEPLRSGLKAYLNVSNPYRQTRRIDNVRFYHGVKITDYVTDTNLHTMYFSSKSLGRINWETSKRLIHGSLLICSSDGFKSFLVFTVADRKHDDLKNGLFKAKFEGDTLPKNYRSKSYVMAESTIFFEAYRSVLIALQKISPHKFPMKDYILGHSVASELPDYLAGYLEEVMYDLSSDHPFGINIMERIAFKRSHRSELNITTEEAEGVRKVSLLVKEKRPSAAELRLDDSQYAAYFVALTQKVSVIQGPPGTGKTYLGLRIVKTLLINKKYWNKNRSSPILVICYTNHALDQFLEGIAKFTRKIVRVGGQSKCEALTQFNLYQWKRTLHNVSRCTLDWIYETKCHIKAIHSKLEELKVFSSQIQAGTLVLNEKSLLSLKAISSDMERKFSLESKSLNRSSCMTLWLGMEARLDFLYSTPDFFNRISAIKSRQVTGEARQESLQEDPVEDDGLEKEDIEEMLANRLVDGPEDEGFDTRKSDADEFEEAIHNLDLDTRDLSQAMRGNYELSTETREIEKLKEYLKICEEQDEAEWIVWQLKEMQWYVVTLQRLVRDSPAATEAQIRQWTERGLGKVPWDKRWMIYAAWIKRAVEYIEGRMSELEKKSQALSRHLGALRDKESAEVCQDMDVIGLTTTGAAKHRALVDHLKPKIVVVEEAAEVLEAHIVTSLSPSCEQLILIGDHQQLRPPVTVFKLVKDYQLDVSLFERLIRNGMKPCVLGVQHRMRPEIARLIVPAIYPTLENHPSVLKYPNVKGLTENVFFASHTEIESTDQDGKSHLNVYEADMCLGLARYLLLQGYKPEQITILTTYSGQLLHMRNLRRDQALLRPIRISVVDNFQGEENDIIILSLVRSNPDESIGFLRIENRICVALSRAKRGFYVFGNMQILRGSNKLWQEISNILSDSGQLGVELPLFCSKHGKHMKVSKHQQFPPEGGCFELCSEMMDCGHACLKLCHASNDPRHEEVKCMIKCSKTCPEGHPCPKLCKDKCPPCQVRVTKVLPCTHEQETACSKAVDQVFCLTVLWKVLPVCGHGLDLACGANPKKVTCPEPCGQLLVCGHACPEKCHADSLVKHDTLACQEPCQRTCPEEHACLKKCSDECGACKVKVIKTLPCGHEKELPCFKNPGEAYCHVKVEKTLTNCQHTAVIECSASTEGFKCQQQCEKQLCADGHPCKKKCFKPCGLCHKRVTRQFDCGHTMTLECHVDPVKVKCRELKEAKLASCGHRVTIKCGDDPATARCSMKCDVRLECGHTCVKNCHAHDDPDHEKYTCRKPCPRLKKGCKLSHKCGKKCFEECAPCNMKWNRTLPCGHSTFIECKYEDGEIPCRVLVKKTTPECGHEARVECSHTPTRAECQETCRDTLPCGHKCLKKCFEPCDSSSCKELVATQFNSLCGHIAKLPCNQPKDTGGALSERNKEELLQSCPEPCGGILDCEHPCRGTCGNCFNGRVHVPCEEPCGRTLVCGHSCKVSCASSCPPCQQMCEQRCVHSRCKLKCGKPCSPCQEPCVWYCEHFKCTQRCGALCDRPVCNDPCKKVLPCGHPCVGLCGEPCPPLCRVCNKDELTEIQFGNEGDDDAKFVFLPECGHCIEVDAMDHWMTLDDNGQIKPKCCPRCKSVIYSCSRYGNITKRVLRDISIVKRKILNERVARTSTGSQLSIRTEYLDIKSNLRAMTRQGLQQLSVLQNCVDESIVSILSELPKSDKNGRYPPLSEENFIQLQMGLDFFKDVIKVAKESEYAFCKQKLTHFTGGKMPHILVELGYRLVSRLVKLVTLFASSKRLTAEGYTRILKEIDRIDYIRAYYVLQSSTMFQQQGSSFKEKETLDNLLIFNARVLTESQAELIKTSLKSLAEKLRTGIGITEREKCEILRAMQLSKGHWYKCANGHIYVIGDCGGAMMESRCNECHAPIGGNNHRLLPSNSLAPEMDGATRSAWS